MKSWTTPFGFKLIIAQTPRKDESFSSLSRILRSDVHLQTKYTHVTRSWRPIGVRWSIGHNTCYDNESRWFQAPTSVIIDIIRRNADASANARNNRFSVCRPSWWAFFYHITSDTVLLRYVVSVLTSRLLILSRPPNVSSWTNLSTSACLGSESTRSRKFAIRFWHVIVIRKCCANCSISPIEIIKATAIIGCTASLGFIALSYKHFANSLWVSRSSGGKPRISPWMARQIPHSCLWSQGLGLGLEGPEPTHLWCCYQWVNETGAHVVVVASESKLS